jgi:hypothetical protein
MSTEGSKDPAAGPVGPGASGAVPAAGSKESAVASPVAAPITTSSTSTVSLAAVPLRPGARVRLGRRTGVIRKVRRGPGAYIHDVKILFDGEEAPIYYPHSTLRTYQVRGDMEVLDPGPPPGFLRRLLHR